MRSGWWLRRHGTAQKKMETFDRSGKASRSTGACPPCLHPPVRHRPRGGNGLGNTAQHGTIFCRPGSVRDTSNQQEFPIKSEKNYGLPPPSQSHRPCWRQRPSSQYAEETDQPWLLPGQVRFSQLKVLERIGIIMVMPLYTLWSNERGLVRLLDVFPEICLQCLQHLHAT